MHAVNPAPAKALFRHLPAMDRILDRLAHEPRLEGLPRPLIREAADSFLDELRRAIREGELSDPAELDLDRLAPLLLAHVTAAARPHFTRVLNATGVVIHTNLGRSLLAESAVRAVETACRHYSNLEFDLGTGGRGSRYSHVEELLCKVTGAEAGLVVNNNASAVLIVLDTLAKGREAIVSRGQLIEIGGSFRIPDVMTKSGARLVEVGTTNRTHLRDYQNAITPETGLLMKVHTSNYRVIGFTKEVSLEDLVALGRERGLPIFEDLGSGTFMDLRPWGLANEPTVQQTVAAGADVVSFSGDKVLGGPQAGIIVGRREVIERIKKNPLNRAIRIDKMTLAALEATLQLYLDPEQARREIPTLAMITADPALLKSKARRLANALGRALNPSGEPPLARIAVRPGGSRVGGGSFPEYDLPTSLVAVEPLAGDSGVAPGVDDLKQALLSCDPPLVGRIEGDAFCLDPRTLDVREFPLAARSLRQAFEAVTQR